MNTGMEKEGRFVVDGVGVELRGRAIVGGVGFAASPGEHIVMVGPNGAGKTTLLRAIVGLVPSTGEVRVGGRRLDALGRRERARLIGYLPQGHTIHWPITVRSLVGLGRFPHGFSGLDIPPADAEIVERAMAAAEIAELADRTATRLSGGETARVALARALAIEAPVLLADEPMASLDPRYRLVMMDLLRRTAHDGHIVLTVVHDLALASRYADRILVLHRGELVADGAPGEVLTADLLAEVFGIRAHRGEHEGIPYLVPWEPI